MPVRFDTQEYNFGIQSQKDNINLLRQLVPNIIEIEDTFAPFDFRDEDNTIFIELKTRRNTKDKYPTTMVPLSKIQKIDPQYTYYFAFKFTDGLYYIQYNKELFDTFEVKVSGRNDRGIPEYENYIFIPVNLLLPLLPLPYTSD
jgi:hypothetical protein